MNKWFKIIMNILAIPYIILGLLHLYYAEDLIYTIWGYGALLFGIGIIEITFLTHVPKLILKSFRNYVEKIVEQKISNKKL